MSCDAAPAAFDAYAAGYDAALDRGIRASGEAKEFFVEGRVGWLARSLRELGESPAAVMDFGCGTGSTAPVLRDRVGAAAVTGVDVSAGSVAEARRRHEGAGLRFACVADCPPEGRFDLAYCNGVFHHIPPAERPGALSYLRDALRPGGLLALWENNPWNPGTRYVMSRIPFDRDAVPLSAVEARRLLRANGFSVVRTDHLFVFPRCLGWLRGLEPRLAGLPLGAQYQVLARKV
jgi:trans-aconitate methyltransferase